MTSGSHGLSGQQSTEESLSTWSSRNPTCFEMNELPAGHELLNPLYITNGQKWNRFRCRPQARR
jgi:hypothetical protein